MVKMCSVGVSEHCAKEHLQFGIGTKDHSSLKWLLSLLDREWHESQMHSCDADSPLIWKGAVMQSGHHFEMGIPLKSSQKIIKF